MNKIRIALADDHNLFRRGMASVLSQIPDVELVLEASNGQELIDKLTRRPPDVVLLDLQMPVLDGIRTTDYLREHHPDMRIIILTMHDEDKFVLHLLEKGVSGYLLKDADIDEVEKAVHQVMTHGLYLNEFVSKAMHRGMVGGTVPVKPPQFEGEAIVLSEREQEILALICEGLSTAEIGERLCLSPRTVEGHRTRILEKTGTRNTAGMVAFAFRNHLV